MGEFPRGFTANVQICQNHIASQRNRAGRGTSLLKAEAILKAVGSAFGPGLASPIARLAETFALRPLMPFAGRPCSAWFTAWAHDQKRPTKMHTCAPLYITQKLHKAAGVFRKYLFLLARRSRRRWELCVRHSAMIPQSAPRFNRQDCRDLRFRPTFHALE